MTSRPVGQEGHCFLVVQQESSPNAELAPRSSQNRVHLQISSGDVAQNDCTVVPLMAPDGTRMK